MYSIYLNIYKHTFYYSNLIQLVACVSDVRDILLLSRLSISDSSLSPASLSAPTFILWPVIMTSMIDSGLLVAQEFQLAQEETLRFKRSSFIVGPLPIFCPRCQCCVSRGHGSPRVQAVVTEVTFLHNLCHQPLSPEHYDTAIHSSQSRSQMAPSTPARPRAHSSSDCGADKAGISPPEPLMSYERWRWGGGDVRPVIGTRWNMMRTRGRHLVMDRQGDVAQDWEHVLMEWIMSGWSLFDPVSFCALLGLQLQYPLGPRSLRGHCYPASEVNWSHKQ